MLRWDDSRRRLTLSVHDLVEAGPAAGDLRPVMASRTRMEVGRLIHQAWQSSRAEEDAAFVAELPIKVTLVIREWECTIQGRIDGVTREEERWVVEELKSTALDADRLAAASPQDWPAWCAQLELYRWAMFAGTGELPLARLVLVSLLDGFRRSFAVDSDPAETGAWVEDRLGWLVDRREERLAWMAARRSAEVPFPFAGVRAGQEEMMAAVERAAEGGGQLLLSAPTGSGKTAAVLHAALKMAFRSDRRVFLATAKGTQQAAFERALADLGRLGTPLRAVTIRAREKVCLNGKVDCRPEVCPYAAGYHDRAAEALPGLLRVVDAAAMEEAARASGVCPFELALEVSEHADVVVGDYNYALSPQSQLRRHFGEGNAKEWILVVDEAHNLVDRARDFWSPSLSAAAAAAVAERLEQEPGMGAFASLARELELAVQEASAGAVSWREGEAIVELSPRIWRDLADRFEELGMEYLALRARRPGEDGWPELGRALLHFVEVMQGMGEETVPMWRQETLRLLCLDPSKKIGPRLASFGAVILMSATLSPSAFYRDLLGLDPERLEVVDLPSPFDPERLGVVVASRVSTAFKDRERDRARTAEVIREVLAASPGNAAVFYSSFGLLQDLTPLVESEREPLVQTPRMDDAARLALVDRLRLLGRPRVLHAVLGGLFSEGIDLPGGVLRTAIIVGPSLPTVGLERELMRGLCEDRYGDGFRYAYLVPGLSRVIQAAGRLVRGPEDAGCVVLVDRRFNRPEYAELLPPWWRVERPARVGEGVQAFWGRARSSR